MTKETFLEGNFLKKVPLKLPSKTFSYCPGGPPVFWWGPPGQPKVFGKGFGGNLSYRLCSPQKKFFSVKNEDPPGDNSRGGLRRIDLCVHREDHGPEFPLLVGLRYAPLSHSPSPRHYASGYRGEEGLPVLQEQGKNRGEGLPQVRLRVFGSRVKNNGGLRSGRNAEGAQCFYCLAGRFIRRASRIF